MNDRVGWENITGKDLGIKESRRVKVHQELRIGPLAGEQESSFIASVVKRLTSGWSRDGSREGELARSMGERFYCFACAKAPNRAAAHLFLTHADRRSTSWLYVANIVPQEIGDLTLEQYNRILTEFATKFAELAAASAGIRIELTSAEQSLEDWLSPESAKLLRSFSHIANKSTGSGHPKDRVRWCDFLISVHRSGEHPDIGLLQRWLVEEEDWPDDRAYELISEYEFGRDLLARFDS